MLIPLLDLNLALCNKTVPQHIRSFLHEAERRIEQFRVERQIPAFVPSDFRTAYQALQALATTKCCTGSLFCEWGSGFGVVTCLAAMLEFDALGIEIEGDLVAEAQVLADDFDLPVEFICGSFIPARTSAQLEISEQFAWLTTDNRGTAEPELEPDDFDVIFAYPWPDEEHVISDLFDRHARLGAVLVTYHGGEEIRVRRKISRSPKRRHGSG